VPLNDVLGALQASKIVNRIVFTKFDGVSNSYTLKVRAELTNGWFLDFWEHKTPKLRRYSFHVFHGNQMLVRWDNTPHYPGLKGFPHHKHEGTNVIESEDMTMDKILKELKKMANIK